MERVWILETLQRQMTIFFKNCILETFFSYQVIHSFTSLPLFTKLCPPSTFPSACHQVFHKHVDVRQHFGSVFHSLILKLKFLTFIFFTVNTKLVFFHFLNFMCQDIKGLNRFKKSEKCAFLCINSDILCNQFPPEVPDLLNK